MDKNIRKSDTKKLGLKWQKRQNVDAEKEKLAWSTGRQHKG